MFRTKIDLGRYKTDTLKNDLLKYSIKSKTLTLQGKTKSYKNPSHHQRNFWTGTIQ